MNIPASASEPSSEKDIDAKVEPKAALATVKGFVERIEPDTVSGWAVGKDGAPIEIVLVVRGQRFLPAIEWHERPDVEEQMGPKANRAGFLIVPDARLRAALSHPGITQAEIVVGANRRALPVLDGAFKRQDATAQVLGIKVADQNLNAKVESWKPFTLQGWVVANDGRPLVLQATINGKPLECVVVRVERKDVAASLGIATLDSGFEVVLPGFLWELAGNADTCEMGILASGRPMFGGKTSLPLSKRQAVAWLDELAGLAEGPQKQYLMLIALEHVRYGKLLPLLGENTAGFVRQYAQHFGLEGFIDGSADESAAASAPLPAASKAIADLDTLLLWRAQRELNDLIAADGRVTLDTLRRVLTATGLRGHSRQQFLLAAVPSLCESGELPFLRELLDFSSHYGMEHADNAWKLSIALALLAADGHVERASGVLYKLAEQRSGWLCTECVVFAARQVIGGAAGGEAKAQDVDNFIYGLIALIDGFRGEWFSRLHDRSLIDAMLAVLADSHFRPDYLQRDATSAAIRNYGLSPMFWGRWSALDEDVKRKCHPELHAANAQFRRLAGLLEEGRHALAARLSELDEPLRFFRERRNPEAAMLLRELCCNLLPGLDPKESSLASDWVRDLLEIAPAEALRLAAHPLLDGQAFIDAHPGVGRRIYESLVAQSGKGHSTMLEVQFAASRALDAFRQAVAEADGDASESQLRDVVRYATALGDWRDQFLGFDLLAAACLVDPAWISVLGSQMRQMLLRAIEETDRNGVLPAPIFSGLRRLGESEGANASLAGALLNEAADKIKSRFGARYDRVLAGPAVPAAIQRGEGQASDTLVIIYSCRKYLDSRVKAIRGTWVQDLKARGIPYLVLVGDGDDTVQGDVLSLAVSDLYEDLPKKTLRMLQWVFEHTDAQFVVKVDDDCFLDVDRYFDSLSYRRHHYYGRVIKRGIGSTDRVWHHPKSKTDFATHSIDKSPEPSVYADGGGGYCVSRLAIASLLGNLRSGAGRRLLGCSFMEDKLVGDLLALGGISPSDEDYVTLQRRRTFGDAIPVSVWEHSSYPSPISPTKLVHLDTETQMEDVRRRRRQTDLAPKRIWPGCWVPEVSGVKPNQLELITPADRLSALLEENFVVVAVCRNEMVMLPHFMAHYRRLGVKAFIFADNLSDDGSREYLCRQPDVAVYSVDTEYCYSHFGVAWQQAILANHCLDKWVLLADIDELLVFDGSEDRSLANLVEGIEAQGANAVCTYMIDMYPFGDLGDADFEKSSPFAAAPWFDGEPLLEWRLGSGWFSNSRSYTSAARHRMIPESDPSNYVSQKYALIRYQPWMRFSQGLHYAANLRVVDVPTWFAHFKYHAGFKKKVATEIRRGQHFNNAEEYRRYASVLAEGRGGLGRPEVSVRYSDSRSFSDVSLSVTENM